MNLSPELFAFYLVTLRSIVSVVKREFLHSPFTVTLRSQECNPASVVTTRLWNVGLGVNLSSKLFGIAIRSEDAQDRQVVFRLAPVIER